MRRHSLRRCLAVQWRGTIARVLIELLQRSAFFSPQSIRDRCKITLSCGFIRGSSMLNNRFLSLVLAALFSLFIAACSSDPEERSCSSLADCEQGQRCDESGVCSSTVKSCETGLDCAADEYCGENTCQPATCSDDAT